MRESIRSDRPSCGSLPTWSSPSPSPSPPALLAIPTERAVASAWPSTISFPPDAIATSFQAGRGSAPWPGRGEAYGLTPSCLAPNTLPGGLCALPQNMAAYWPSMPPQHDSPAAEGGSSQWQSGIVRAGASRRLPPSKSFWPRARGPVSCWRKRALRHGGYDLGGNLVRDAGTGRSKVADWRPLWSRGVGRCSRTSTTPAPVWGSLTPISSATSGGFCRWTAASTAIQPGWRIALEWRDQPSLVWRTSTPRRRSSTPRRGRSRSGSWIGSRPGFQDRSAHAGARKCR